MKAKSVNFERGRDPKNSMGIGIDEQIHRWFDEVFPSFKPPYRINPDKTIDILGDFEVPDTKIGEFPDYINFRYCTGEFMVDFCELTSLRGCPKIVDGFFSCEQNKLISLEGMPDKVGRDIFVRDNPGKFTKEDVIKNLKYYTEINRIYSEDSRVDESINFERGREPKRAMSVGHAAIYPDKELFKEIHEYCKDNKFPEWQDVSPIEWSWEEPLFIAIAKKDEGLRWGNKKEYTLYLTEIGVKCFVDYDDKAGYPDQDEYSVEDFSKWIRILEANHVQYIPIDKSGSMRESVNFERGQDPKHAMNIGASANPFVIVYAEREVDDNGYITGPLPEEHDQNTWYDSATDSEILDVLKNWEEMVDGSWYFHGHMKDNDDEDGDEMFHAPEFNDEWVEYMGKKYYIPDHKEYWDKLY